ncbi:MULTISPECIES: PrkA family serine protein kinase [Chloracidobacterium]|jgi:serine protein kinase|uniref:Putative Ser protein kinase n=1 Tax=Chloracidobacterium thermophilum (strain B) TaxID=981222 RepID=G2LFU6_CHLTF|nr:MULTISPECIES: protein PrkA [Chloracidobacterium]AEP11740.1 Putative Ser protein kinase [Chloracidobacterium thermophilum B]QUV79613.1 protein prkA [Chloracidobacterium thermophilum]QUV82650.1 protein prkA [Chloracidobacterium sp. D]
MSDTETPKPDITQLLEAHRRDRASLHWEGTFREYFEMAVKRPQLTQLAHARICDMILAAGTTVINPGTRDEITRYNFFSEELFGIDETIEQLVEYFKSAAQRLEVRKRILLLMGPVGGGKSTIVTLLKRGLEKWTRTEAGAVYAIKGDPMHGDPMHLIPQELRPEIQKHYGIYIEGELSPQARYDLEHTYKGRHEDVIVERIVFSEKDRVGIGTFAPSDPKSQDVSELTGSIDLSTIGEVGVESDPRAYRFDGELNVANRGMMEFIEILKCDEKFLYSLLTLSQEQAIKTGRYAMIYADEVIISHTNENEYLAFVGNKKNEALQDRIIMIKVPYNLKVSEEERIYKKLLSQSSLQGMHIAPYTLRVAAMFAVLTRLEPPKRANMDLIKKMKLYDGEDVDGFKSKDVKELKAETVREGMFGISPRYIINCLSNALVQGEKKYITPIDALRAIRDGFDQHTGITPEEREKYLNLLTLVRKEYDEIAKTEVQRAFVYSFEEMAKSICDNYLDNVEAYCNKEKIKDPITEEEMEPDERLMRSIEEQIGISENAKNMFRQEILIRISTYARKGKRFEYNSHERLKEAIEKKIFADLKDIVKITTSTKSPDADQLRRINEVIDRLVKKHGYTPESANELLNYVGSLLSR